MSQESGGHREVRMEAWQALFRHSPDGAAFHRVVRDGAGQAVDFEYLAVNLAFAALAGSEDDSWPGRRGRECWSDDAVNLLLARAEAALAADGANPQRFDYHATETDRHFSLVLFRSGPDEFGTITRDVGWRRGAENRLDLLAATLDQAGESILVTDTSGTIEYVNQAFRELWGYAEHEVLGRVPWELLATRPEPGDDDQTPLWHRILGQERWSGRAVKRRKDGASRNTQSTANAVRDQDGVIRHYVMIDRDATLQLALEARLQQASKLEAIGQLSGGLAHDFNNMLTVICGHNELLYEALQEDGLLGRLPAVRDYLQQIEDATERAVTLTGRLLAFSRREDCQPRVVTMNEVVSGMTGFLRGLLSEAVEVRLDLMDEPLHVKVDPAQIEQVIMNLAANARDAMQGRGRLAIGTARAVLDEHYAREYPEVVPGTYVRLTVTDAGCGMDAETQARLFEPFFTTKSAEEGTGLGLAVVHGIVGQNHGHIHCYSEPGKGTTFSLYFPVVDEAPSLVTEDAPAALRSGSEHILVVEDDPGVRSLTVATLRAAGYQVVEAISGGAALVTTAEPALLITDLTLGDTDGLTIMEALTLRWPGLRTLCISGYPLASLDPQLDIKTIPNFLAKPFRPAELRQKVREILDA